MFLAVGLSSVIAKLVGLSSVDRKLVTQVAPSSHSRSIILQLMGGGGLQQQELSMHMNHEKLSNNFKKIVQV